MKPENIDVPGPGQESVWDYPRPPAVEEVDELLTVVVCGQVVAKTTKGFRVIETSSPPVYYFPPNDVEMSALQRNKHRTICEWKGQASYWDIAIGDCVVEHAAWSYENPMKHSNDYGVLKNYLAFYAQKADECYVAGEKVIPQPGSFYGGWITSKLTGPFKGEPGSQYW